MESVCDILSGVFTGGAAQVAQGPRAPGPLPNPLGRQGYYLHRRSDIIPNIGSTMLTILLKIGGQRAKEALRSLLAAPLHSSSGMGAIGSPGLQP
ncbi:hypothetical protein AVEN_160348-1 [Araneus ventricosus]|uniref:Uncharacterized protein n=1 Tax=Araneus ventricosus TaxID=182803 RepID=A0A4Y2VDB8_ARAVE|nr:hypothetical protein AVEN_160348-1 [Araneus ventricosus]